MRRNNPIPIVKDLPAKERNLWTGIVLIITIWLTPSLFNLLSQEFPSELRGLFGIFYLITMALLMIVFLLYTTPTNPTQYQIRRKQFLMLFLILMGYLMMGVVLMVFFGERMPTLSGTTIVMNGMLFDLWFVGLLIISTITFIWYLITMWHRNPAAIFFPNPIFLIRKHPNKSKQAIQSHKNMKKKLGRQ